MTPQAHRSTPKENGEESPRARQPDKPDESYAEQQKRLGDEGRGGPEVKDKDDNGE